MSEYSGPLCRDQVEDLNDAEQPGFYNPVVILKEWLVAKSRQSVRKIEVEYGERVMKARV